MHIHAQTSAHCYALSQPSEICQAPARAGLTPAQGRATSQSRADQHAHMFADMPLMAVFLTVWAGHQQEG